jgi:uncharacterized protein YabN with tetrapyrrole methylase and pyrophosphatase domain
MRKGSITVVGTGHLVAGQVTPEALVSMKTAKKLFYLVGDPATAHWVETLNPTAETLANSFSVGRNRMESYNEIVERVIKTIRMGLRVTLAFYGHPGVFVDPSHEVVRRARAEGFNATMLPGISAEDCLFADLGVDPGQDGCQSYEATDFLLRRRKFDPRTPLILWQVGCIGVATYCTKNIWSRAGLRLLTKVLRNTYPAEHQVVIYEAPEYPVCRPVTETVSLSKLPQARVSIISTLFVPPREFARTDRKMLARLSHRAD